MKIWIVTAFLLLIAVATMYVVWTVVLTSSGPGQPYDIPKGRYDCFMSAQVTVMSEHFPEPRTAGGPMPLPPKADYEESRDLLGRTFTVGVYGKDKTFARLAAQEALRRIQRIAEIADPASESSELSQINREAADRAIVLSDDMYYLLKRATEISEKSRGAFDLTVGPLRALWQASADRGMLPSAEQIAEARSVVGMQFVQLDHKKHAIRFKKKGVTLDLRDVIGGFAADQAVHSLRIEAVTSGYVRAGDCWRTMQHPWAETGQTWILGIPDPRPNRAGQAGRTFGSDRGAVASKGYYSGYRFIGSSVVSDIIDPRTGNCVGGVAVCTVVGPDAMTCDAMATTLVVLGGSQATFFLGQFNPRDDEKKPKRLVPGE